MAVFKSAWLIFGILMLAGHCQGYQYTVIQIVKDLVDHEGIPTIIVLMDICWTWDAIRNLTKEVPHQFQFSPQIYHENDVDNPNALLHLIDLNCDTANDVISKTHPRLFARPYRWIIINKIENHPAQYDAIESIEAYPDSNVILITTLNETSYQLDQFYHIEPNSPLITEDFGTWNTTKRLVDMRKTRILSRRRQNLHGKILTSSLVITDNDTFNHLWDYEQKEIDSITKVHWFLIEYWMEAINATKELIFVDTWGYYDAKANKWTGMIGHLDRQEADIGGTSLFMIPNRIPVIDYITMTVPTLAKFVFRAPPLSYVANIYTLPFNTSVWLCLGASMIIFCVAILATYKFVPHYKEADSPNREGTRVTDAILLAVGAICQMGHQFEPRLYSSRITSFIIFMAMLFFYTSYTANIVALLQSTTGSIKTLADLLHSQMEFGVVDTVYNRYYFTTETEPTRKAIYEQKIAPPKKPERFMNLSYGVSRLREGLFAIHMELGAGYKLVEETFYENEKCGLMGISYIQVGDPWLAIQKNSRYKEILKVNLLRLREYGLQSRQHDKIYTKRPICDSHGQNFGSVRLTDCMFSVILLGYGFLLSFLIFLIEQYYAISNLTKEVPHQFQFSPQIYHDNDVDNPNALLHLIDLNCDTANDVISKTHPRLFARPYRWIIINKIENHPAQYDVIESIEAYPDSNVILITTLNETSYQLNQFYHIEPSSPLITEDFGTWNKTNRLEDMRKTRIISRRRKNLQGKLLTSSLVVTDNDTLNHLWDYEQREIDPISKVHWFIIEYWMEVINATRQFLFVDTWGYYDAKANKWTGMIGHLDRREADIGGTSLYMIPNRLPVIDYLTMTVPTSAKFVFRAPPLSYVANIYTLPFNTSVWLCLGASIIIFIGAVLATYKFVPHNWEADSSNRQGTRVTDAILLAVGAICQMGHQFEPRLYSSRITSFIIFMAMLFFYTSYTANIVALLQSTTGSIKTLADLLNSEMEFGAVDTVYNRFYFTTETEPIRKAIYEQKIAPPNKPNNFMNLSHGVSRLREGLFVIHMELGAGYKLVEETFYENEKCGLTEMTYIQVVDPWLAIQKHSRYKEILKVNLLRLREYGLQSRQFDKIYTKRPVCDSHGQNFGSVRLTDCMFSVILLGYGFLLSFLIFLIEKYYKSKKTLICYF